MIRARVFLFAAALTVVPLLAVSARAQTVDRAVLENEIRQLIGELKETEQQFLAPSAKDRARYADFLTQPDTGLIRLLPREIFQDKLTIAGGGAYYSFASQSHEYGLGSDIQLEQGRFKAGFSGSDFGFLTRLGKVAIEDITLDHPGAQFLSTFAAPTRESDAREQQTRAAAGFDVNGFTYISRDKVKRKTSYLLRSVVYGVSDLLVVFRIVTEARMDVVPQRRCASVARRYADT